MPKSILDSIMAAIKDLDEYDAAAVLQYAEFLQGRRKNIPPRNETMSENLKSKSTQKLVSMFEDTDPAVDGDIEKRRAIMAILEKRNPSMYFEWVSSEHNSPRGYFLNGNAATATRRKKSTNERR
jgi:hypothetical protein